MLPGNMLPWCKRGLGTYTVDYTMAHLQPDVFYRPTLSYQCLHDYLTMTFTLLAPLADYNSLVPRAF